MSYTCIQSGAAGEENITRSPAFADADGPDDDPDTYEDNDYRLSQNSPCVDTGVNEVWMQQAVDLDGNPRIYLGNLSRTVDMGAYEFGSWPFRIVGMARAASGQAELTWSSRPGETYAIWSSSNLSGKRPWTTKEASVLSDGDTTTWTDPDTTSPLKFYRIEIE